MTHFYPTDQINGGAMAPPAPPLATPLRLHLLEAFNIFGIEVLFSVLDFIYNFVSERSIQSHFPRLKRFVTLRYGTIHPRFIIVFMNYSFLWKVFFILFWEQVLKWPSHCITWRNLKHTISCFICNPLAKRTHTIQESLIGLVVTFFEAGLRICFKGFHTCNTTQCLLFPMGMCFSGFS